MVSPNTPNSNKTENSPKAPASSQESQSSGPSPFAPPSISLPKGGGAIRGMGEKFAANPVTGTGSMSVPLAVSPGRGGFGPQLSLSYDSGAGNGPFGLGWNLSLPAITRKTDKGLPRYNDAEESDVFILSGAEDLVPVLNQNGQPPAPEIRNGFQIKRYRPRIEGLFARIERWTNITSGEIHWRSITKDNITTLYGKDNYSRIFDPAELNQEHPTDLAQAHPKRIFSWLICESYDDKGNAILYEYKPEDSIRVETIKANETNRTRTANRYLKRIKYCNQTPRAANGISATPPVWLMEVVLDYGEHHDLNPMPVETKNWDLRTDPFSTYRSGFEVRTYRFCRRVLMFHHFPNSPGQQDGYEGLVRSTDFTYTTNHIASFISKVTQSGYNLNGSVYVKRSLPPVEFTYSQAEIQGKVEDLDAESLDNLPMGLDGATYQWTDLDGEGISGILTEQAGAWFYKRNLSPINPIRKDEPFVRAKFAPVELIATRPNATLGGQAQFMDLAGDGQPDLVVLDGPMPGFYEHDEGWGWNSFRPFTSRLNFDTRDPNVKFVDLDGDGHADVLITEHDVLTWHPSLAEAGFGAARRVRKTFDEEKGPALVFADGTQSIYLADFSGDGLTDLVRIRNGEVCYWPNLGYGKFGAKVTMDNAPWFDHPDQFDQRRIRLADIDGSGVTDIIYLHGDGVQIYLNQSGNSWSAPQPLAIFPRTDNLSSVTVTDLLGNGTACLVWSSPLPGEARRQMRYVDLMGGQKPHLMISSKNNLGAETKVQYASSTKFYLEDKYAGKPWITRLPFPVHVVERVETFDHISHNHFVSRYAYHHGYFDGVEREFRGFGMVEQWDTDEFNKLDQAATNVDASWHMPPVHTKTWFHTGAYFRGQEISRHLAHEYFGAPKDATFETWLNDSLLPDTVFPIEALSANEQRQACRALKGAMLRQEVYADDDSAKAGIPYTVTEQNFTIERVQPQANNRHAVFFTHPREAISYHYERDTRDPRVTHAMTLKVDPYGNVLKSLAIGYGRRTGQSTLQGNDKAKQERILITYTESDVTHAIDDTLKNPDGSVKYPEDYRTPLPSDIRTYELTGITPENGAQRFSFEELTRNAFAKITSLAEEQYEWDVNYTAPRKRLIEHLRTLYRPDDCGAAQNNPLALLPPGVIEPRALPGESYKQAFTPGLAKKIYVDSGKLSQVNLDSAAHNEGKYMHSQGDANWWIPSGRVFFALPRETEPDEAQQHFYLPRRFRDPFGNETTIDYDSNYDLLPVSTTDALENTVSAAIDYRVLAPYLVTDPNGNRTEVKFDILGMVAGTAVMGKTTEHLGDSLTSFVPDLSQQELNDFFANPRGQADSLLRDATTRIVYDLDRFRREGKPPFAATIAGETHASEPAPAGGVKYQVSFSYSDGFGREIQKKIQAEPGKLDLNDPAAPIVNPRWVGSGWTIFNNKGKPVRQYEPFFDDTHDFKFGQQVGVSPILFYDPVERVVATLHPNHTYEKVVFDPWQQTTWDVNDTTRAPERSGAPPFNPKDDPDVGHYFKRLPDDEYLPTWHTLRTHSNSTAIAVRKWPKQENRDAESNAADKAAKHTDTPTVAHLDTLGRTFLTFAHNGFTSGSHPTPILFATRVELDIEGNQRAVRDAIKKAWDDQGNEVIDELGRIVMQYDYDMLGTRIHQSSMEAGERWMLNNVAGKPIRGWNSRRFDTEHEYDALQRPIRMFVTGKWDKSQTGRSRKLVEEIIYGESLTNPERHNLRGKVWQHFDTAGIVTNIDYDFKGNLLAASRQFLVNYKETPNWSSTPAPAPESEIFTSRTKYDALNRTTELTTPHTNAITPNVIRPVYNEAGLLNSVNVSVRGAAATDYVANIDYNEKGQREKIEYGNRAITTYTYDKETFRLTNLKTTRPPGLNGLSSQLFKSPTVVQDLCYVYDPAGNITQIADDAVKTVINGVQIKPIAEYTYDAIYRLIEATGREHIPQTEFNFTPDEGNYRDYPFWGNQANPNDPRSLQNYTESYEYDAVGNFGQVIHKSSNPATPGWTRGYDYAEASLIEDGSGVTLHKISNRLSRTTINGNGANPFIENYSYDDHGNMTQMAHLHLMKWDFRDQLQATSQQHVTNGNTPETTWYVYDSSGQRVRKVTDNSASASNRPTCKAECFYLGGFEIYREYGSNRSRVTLERETLHVMDDKQRIALVETKTKDVSVPANTLPKILIRYQFGNHLGSACLELDGRAGIVSYEEYFPYGCTSYQISGSQAEAPKRYRYTGKERDEESGMYYHGARYYAGWIGRWTCPDPIDLDGGINMYGYGAQSPIALVDPSGMAPQKYENQRGLDTDAKEREMKKNLEEAKKKGFAPDPLQKRAGDMAKTPGEHHHHTGVKQAWEVGQDPKEMGKWMRTLWSTKRDPTVQAGRGGAPVWDPNFEGEKRTPHNIAKGLDLAEQAKGPKTAKGLDNAGKTSKDRIPANWDLTERAKHDWTRSTDKGPPVDPQTGNAKGAKMAPDPRSNPKLVKAGEAEAARYTNLRGYGPKGGTVDLHAGLPLTKTDLVTGALEIFRNKQDEIVESISQENYYSLSDEQLEFMDYAGYERDYNTGKWKLDPDFEGSRNVMIGVLILKKSARYFGDWIRASLSMSGSTPSMFSAR